MRRNISLGFVEPKIKPLFTIKIELDPYVEETLQKGCQDVTIMFNGSVYTGGKYAGEVPIWDYITQFDKPRTMRRIAFNIFEMDVRGDADLSLIAEPTAKRPYTYDAILTDTPAMILNREYLCSMILQDDHFDVIFDSKKIGEVWDKKKRGTIKKIDKMISYGWRTTAAVSSNGRELSLSVSIVKV